MVNKIDLAPYVDVDAVQMVADATAARDGLPVLALSQKDHATIDQLSAWLRQVIAAHRAGSHTPRRIRGRWRRTSMPMKKTTVTVTGTATLTLTDAHWSYAGRRRESG